MGVAWKGIQKFKKETPELLLGDMYEKEYGHIVEDQGGENARAPDPMQVDMSKTAVADDSITEKGSASTDVTMEENGSQEDTKKRKLPIESENAAVDAMKQMMQMMQVQSEAKDTQIEALTATINGLQAQMQQVMGAMKLQEISEK